MTIINEGYNRILDSDGQLDFLSVMAAPKGSWECFQSRSVFSIRRRRNDVVSTSSNKNHMMDFNMKGYDKTGCFHQLLI